VFVRKERIREKGGRLKRQKAVFVPPKLAKVRTTGGKTNPMIARNKTKGEKKKDEKRGGRKTTHWGGRRCSSNLDLLKRKKDHPTPK